MPDGLALSRATRPAGRAHFGEKALALKHGKLSLAVEKGKVVAVERG